MASPMHMLLMAFYSRVACHKHLPQGIAFRKITPLRHMPVYNGQQKIIIIERLLFSGSELLSPPKKVVCSKLTRRDLGESARSLECMLVLPWYVSDTGFSFRWCQVCSYRLPGQQANFQTSFSLTSRIPGFDRIWRGMTPHAIQVVPGRFRTYRIS